MLKLKALPLGVLMVFAAGFAAGDEVIPNWSAPATWSPHSASRGVSAMAAITNPLPFIGVTPCRQYDSRNTSPLPDNTPRAVTITGAPCGLPAAAAAVSLNVTVFDILGQGGNAVFKAGTTSPPTTAWINYPPGQGQIGNAGVLPLNGSGQIVFQVNQGGGSIDFTIDVNGYYSDGELGALDSGEKFTLLGDVSGTSTGLLVVHNTEGVSAARAGYFVADSSGFGSTGIAGIETAATGLTAGVYGQASSSTTNTAGVSGVATTTFGQVYGVSGQTSSVFSNSAGVYGKSGGATGRTYGVFGVDFSSDHDAAGVKGVAGGDVSLPFYALAGVRGDSLSNYGVLGVSQNQGVAGSVISSVDTELAYGILGFNSGTAYGVYAGGPFGGTGAKYFIEPHPTDASKVIRYVSLEGPEAGTYFRGRGKFQNGLATIEVPEDFRMVTDPEGLSIQVTPIGELATVAVVRLDLEEILVKASRNVEFFYTVNGVRKTHRDLKPIGPGSEFMPRSADARMPLYLTEGQKALLVSNGTYNADGTVNMETAERLGWTKIWADREAQAKAAAAANAAASSPLSSQK